MPGKEGHGRLLHPASSYPSIWENIKVANGNGIANYVNTCIGALNDTEHRLEG
jgi:hypothetical protein